MQQLHAAEPHSTPRQSRSTNDSMRTASETLVWTMHENSVYIWKFHWMFMLSMEAHRTESLQICPNSPQPGIETNHFFFFIRPLFHNEFPADGKISAGEIFRNIRMHLLFMLISDDYPWILGRARLALFHSRTFILFRSCCHSAEPSPRVLLDYSFFSAFRLSIFFPSLFVNPKFAFLSDFHHLLCERNSKTRNIFAVFFFTFLHFPTICAPERNKKKTQTQKEIRIEFFFVSVSHWFFCQVFFFWSIPSGGSLVRLSDSQTDIQLSRHVRCLCSFGPRATSRNGKSTLGMELHFPTLLVFSSINTHLNAHSINALHWMRITMIIYFDSHWIVC